MNYYNYDKNDVAKSIQQAINDRAEPSIVQYLVDERNKKIGADGQYGRYANDTVTQSAKAYINKYTGANDGEIEALYQARRDLAAQNLENAGTRSFETYKSGLAGNAAAYGDARKDIYSAYRRSVVGNEEALAANGLGRGISNKASSGFGETSRIAQNIAYQNNVYDSYKSQDNAARELAGKYMQSQNEAQKQYNDTLSQLASERTTQANADREYGYRVDQDRLEENRYYAEQKAQREVQEYEHALDKFRLTGVVDDEQQSQVLGLDIGTTTAEYQDMVFNNDLERLKFNSSEEQRAFDNSLAERNFASELEQNTFERAYDLFKGAGNVVNDQMASVLGIPVGTDYWEYVIAAKNANTNYLDYTVKSRNASTSASRAASSASNAATKAENDAKIKYLNYEVAKQNADTNTYKAQTDRMKLTGDY